MAETTDNTDSVSHNKYVSNQTLFPILGSQGKSAGTSRGLIFPCASSSVETKSAYVDKGVSQPSWLRNESYKDVSLSFQTDQQKIVHTECKDYSMEQTTDMRPRFEYQGSKRTLVDISSSDEEKQLRHDKEFKKEHCGSTEKVRKHHRDKKKHKQKEKRKHKYSKAEHKEHITEDVCKPDTIWIEEANLAPEKAYRLHKKPDLANRMYNTLYRLDIALYKMRSNVTCLGLGKHQVIELTEQKGKKKKKTRTVGRYWNVNDFQLEVTGSTENVSMTLPSTVKKPDQRIDLGDIRGYVPLELSCQDEMAKKDSLRRKVEESTADKDSHESEILQKTRELNKILNNNQQDIQTWLALVDFQEEIVRKEDSVKSSFTATGQEKRKAATRTIIEKKIAIFEKALQKNPNSVQLIVGHLDLCNEIMDAEELVQKWKQVSFVHPNNTLLWKHYLLFMQSRFSVFSFSKTAAVYNKCLSTLSSIKEGTFASHQAEGDLESEMVDLFIRECQFTKQSGHTEKAVACFQAMIELNCFCSPDMEKNTPVTGQIAFLETFWDSGQARFGENGARGWKSWMAGENKAEVKIDVKKIFKANSTSAADESDSLDDDDDDDDDEIDKDKPLWKNWVQVELSRQRRNLLPWQPDAEKDKENDCDDAERLVLFDDISSSLFKIADPRNKLKLVLSFLKLLGVSVPCASSSTSADVQRFLNISLEHESQLLEPGNSTMSQFLGLWLSYQWDDGISTNTTDKQWPSSEALHLARNVFVQILPVFEGATRSFLMVLWLWFEFGLPQKVPSLKESKKKYKEVRKLAKSLLKQPENRNDLTLWKAFAEIEWLSGNTDEARRVFHSTLMMGSELFSDEHSRRTALAPLVRSYAELEVGVNGSSKESQVSSGDENKKALWILTAFAEGAKFQSYSSNASITDVSAVRLLKSRRTYQKFHQGITETTESSQEKGELPDCVIASGSLAVHLEACSALFEYLNTGIQGVLSMCNDFISLISHNEVHLIEMDIELILSCYIRLFRFHCTHGRTLPLKDTRNIVHFALEKFPDNPEFLSFYIQRESKSILTGEVRRTLDKATQRATTPVPWIFAIYYEQLRAKSLVSVIECNDLSALVSQESSAAVTSLPVTGVVHRQCSLFERAICSPSGRHCVALWRMFMQFESKLGKKKVKSVFYQALQSCPWAKVLYMDAVQHMPDDIQDIVDLMTEKEIRLHAPLEEIELLLQE